VRRVQPPAAPAVPCVLLPARLACAAPPQVPAGGADRANPAPAAAAAAGPAPASVAAAWAQQHAAWAVCSPEWLLLHKPWLVGLLSWGQLVPAAAAAAVLPLLD